MDEKYPSPLEIYLDVVDWLDDKGLSFVSRVASMGAPRMTDKTEYAYTTLENDMLITYINVRTMKDLSDEERAFVITHELCHILFGDLHKLDRFDDSQKFNIAADCVINDFLESIDLSCGSLEIFHGDATVGQNCSDLTVEEVYPLLPDSVEGTTCSLSDEDIERIIGDNSDWFNTVANIAQEEGQEELSEALEAQGGDSEESDDDKMDNARGCGSEQGSVMKPPPINLDVIADWDNLIKELHRTYDRRKINDAAKMRKSNPSFHRPDSKAAHLYPQIFVPSRRASKKAGTDEESFRPKITVAIDSSGSINERMLRDFLGVVEKLDRRKVDVHCITFSTVARFYDLENKGSSIARGGTAFNCIQTYIQKNKLENNAVVVITDGESWITNVPKDQKDRWLFVIEPSNGWGYRYKTFESAAHSVASEGFATVAYDKFFN